MEVRATTDAPADTGADAIAVGLVEGEKIAHDLEGGLLQGLVDAREARAGVGRLAHVHAGGARWILVGLGAREGLDSERARRAAAAALARARELSARTLCWEVPHGVDDAFAGALVEGTLLAGYRYERYKTAEPERDPDLEELVVSAHHDVGDAVARARVLALATNAARDLQNAPANELTPSALAARAKALAKQHDRLSVDVDGPKGIASRGMGAFSAVAQGSAEDPALITLRYEPPDGDAGAAGPILGFVGKAVTFDTGGISIKPAATMHEMKFDMSGGAAVIEALGAIAALELPVRVIGVVGATENMPGGRAVKPGDIVRSKAGLTIEVNNTDAEGRLVLADCMAHARELGAERLVDLATLTGAIVTALGSAYSGLFCNDDAWAGQVQAAGAAAGERVWRMPLDPAYADMVKGRYADLTNLTEPRGKASAITAAELLHRFAGDVPWAHLDIAGTAWNLGVPYARKGGSGMGVRLLVELARAVAAAG